MKFDELKNLSMSELYEKAGDLKREALNIRIQAASLQDVNKGRLRGIRRDIARIKTRIHQIKQSA